MKKLVLLATCLLAALALTACGGLLPDFLETAAQTTEQTTAAPQTSATTVATAETSPALTAEELFEKARAASDAFEAECYSVELSRTTVAGNNTYTELWSYRVDLIPGEEPVYSAFGTFETENLTVDFTEDYRDGKFFTVYEDLAYLAQAEVDEMEEYIFPRVLFTPELYGEMSLSGENKIVFASPEKAEAWLGGEGVELISAGGEAELSDGIVSVCNYTAEYALAGVNVTVEVKTEYLGGAELAEAPEIPADVITVSEPAVPQLMFSAYFKAREATDMVISTIDQTLSAAGGVYYSVSNNGVSADVDGDYQGRLEYESYIKDYSTGEESEYSEKIEFAGGDLSVYSDDELVSRYGNYERDDFNGLLLSDALDAWGILDEFGSINAENIGGIIYLEFTGSEDLALELSGIIQYDLFGDFNVLDGISTDYRTEELVGYMGINAASGLLTGLGYEFEGIHVIDGEEWSLIQLSSTSVTQGTRDAYTELTEELPEVTDARTPTPLFYKVTGENGQQMWLFGTIHVGDGRTAVLPDGIYAALDSSSALAVEFDSEAYEEELDNSEEAMDALSELYFYEDGSFTKDHVEDEELFEYAQKLVRASGSVNMNTEYFQMWTWKSMIESLFEDQSYSLSPERGVDNMLMKHAREKGIEILDVESGQEQMAMIAGYSDRLQELLLAEAVSADTASTGAGMEELFDLWCSGDEEALRDFIVDDEADLAEMTEEELALYEEYKKAMETDRNAGMHDVAVGYLESGETVFYAVGLAHLLAEDGLVNTLRASGYTVELVVFE